MPMTRRVVTGSLLAVLWLATGPAHAASAAPAGSLVDDRSAVEAIVALADERLSLMPAVAAAKWRDHLALADPAREAAVISAAADRAHALGLDVHVWTINDRAAMIRLLDLGADGIMTDDIETLRDVLIERGQWHPRATT